jgi:glycerol kinase
MEQYIVALDQGTTSSRALLFRHNQTPVGMVSQEFAQKYPQPGWVEHDPMEILRTQTESMQELLQKSGVSPAQIAAIGITNQRETAVIWERDTGKPIYNAIVWQCRRTSDFCEELIRGGHAERIRAITGLPVDAYFSASKFRWILEHLPGARERARRGELLAGTIDSWLVWNLTGGKVHVTDYSNASRTMLYDIHNLCWSDELLELFDIPRAMLPQVAESSKIYGYTELGGTKIPIAGIAGDQQAALFGQACFERGQAKNTYGTGCFLLMNTGSEAVSSKNGLVTTIAWGLGSGVQYALEGSVFIGGAVVQWLRDELGIIEDAGQMQSLCGQVEDTGGVYVVPAFAGLGAPYWDMYARGCIVGLTRGSGRLQIIRAAEESIAYQVCDVVHAMREDAGELQALRVDGGASRDAFLLQFQADMLNLPVHRVRVMESSALGAAYFAGLAVGFWKDLAELRAAAGVSGSFEPAMPAQRRATLYSGWKKAVARSAKWTESELD